MTQEDHNSMARACCNTCLLAEAMRDCPNCVFYPWLGFKALRTVKAGQSEDYPPELFHQTRKDFVKAIKAQKGESK